MSIQKRTRTIHGEKVTYYYPVISTYKYDKSKTSIWGPGFPDELDARVEERKMKKALEKSLFANRLKSLISFQEIRKDWLDTRINKPESTRERDKSYCELYLSVFDDFDIRKITAMDIQDWVILLSEKYAPKTVNMAFNLLSQIMEYAVAPLNLIKKNPCKENIQRPKIKHRGIDATDFWTEEELKYFLSHPLTQKNHYYAMYLIHATFGMRPGEICGLATHDISLNRCSLTLNHGLDKKNRLTDLKNSGAQRTLRIPQKLLETFKVQIACSNVLRASEAPYPFLFVTKNGTPVNTDMYRKYFTSLIKRINQQNDDFKLKPISPYGLRHTFATLSLIKGIHIKAVAEIMGDAVDTVMNNYVHILEQMTADSLENFADSILGE